MLAPQGARAPRFRRTVALRTHAVFQLGSGREGCKVERIATAGQGQDQGARKRTCRSGQTVRGRLRWYGPFPL